VTPLLAQTIVSAVLDAAAYAHVASTWFMVGLIWFVQLVHYPMMARADRAAFDDFEREHQRRTTWIVPPVMLVAAVTCFAMLPPFVGGYMSPQGLLGTAAAALLIGVWVSTAALQVPDHRRLER